MEDRQKAKDYAKAVAAAFHLAMSTLVRSTDDVQRREGITVYKPKDGERVLIITVMVNASTMARIKQVNGHSLNRCFTHIGLPLCVTFIERSRMHTNKHIA